MAAGDWKEMFLAACAGDTDLVRHHLDNGVDADFARPIPSRRAGLLQRLTRRRL